MGAGLKSEQVVVWVETETHSNVNRGQVMTNENKGSAGRVGPALSREGSSYSAQRIVVPMETQVHGAQSSEIFKSSWDSRSLCKISPFLNVGN